MSKIEITYFIGKQLSRLKLGQSYYILVMSTITALSLVSMAFPNINFLIFIFFVPIFLFMAFFIGYLMDKTNIATMDYRKSIEIQSRYLNTIDFKNNEFRILMMTTIFKWIRDFQNNKLISYNDLKEQYEKFLKKWNPN